MNDAFHVLGYDIGGTKLAIGLLDSNGRIIGKARIDNKDTHPDDVLPQMVAIGEKMVNDAGLSMRDIRAFGISAPYPADPVHGVMTAPPNNPKWRNVPVLQYLEDALGIPGVFENDANCAALAEWFFGAGRGCEDFIYLTMSTGIGGGIIAANRLVRGRRFKAGEIGHIPIERNGIECACGLHGCYEAYCGGRSVALRIQQELRDKPDHPMVRLAGGVLENIDMVVLERAVRERDDYAVKFWDDMCRRNAQAFGLLLSIFNPSRLILGTFAWAAGELFMEPVRRYLPEYTWPQMISDCEIVPSELRREIGYYAGAAAVFNHLKEKAAVK